VKVYYDIWKNSEKHYYTRFFDKKGGGGEEKIG